jgi:NitT/TauT family transport system permease protein
MAYVTDKPAFGARLFPSREKAARPKRRLEFGTFTYGLPLMVVFFGLWEIAPASAG